MALLLVCLFGCDAQPALREWTPQDHAYPPGLSSDRTAPQVAPPQAAPPQATPPQPKPPEAASSGEETLDAGAASVVDAKAGPKGTAP